MGLNYSIIVLCLDVIVFIFFFRPSYYKCVFSLNSSAHNQRTSNSFRTNLILFKMSPKGIYDERKVLKFCDILHAQLMH